MKDLKVYLILALAITVVILLLTRPNPGPSQASQDREKAYQTQNAILKVEKDAAVRKADSIRTSAIERARKDSIDLRASNAEISRLKANSRKKVAAIPVKAIEDYPEITEALEAKDSVITELDGQNALLSESNYATGKELTATLDQVEIVQRVGDEMLANCEKVRAEDNKEHEKQMKKQRFKTTLFKITTVLAGIGGILLGSQ